MEDDLGQIGQFIFLFGGGQTNDHHKYYYFRPSQPASDDLADFFGINESSKLFENVEDEIFLSGLVLNFQV